MFIDLDNLTIEQSRLFNEVALEIREEYNELIENISINHTRNLFWLFSSIASRNGLTSPLFMRCCILTMLDKIVSQQGPPQEIITLDIELAKTLRCSQTFQHCKITCKSTIWHLPQKLLILSKNYLKNCFYIISRLIAKVRYAHLTISENSQITLIDIYVLEGTKGPGRIENGIYNDRYYPGIMECVPDQEKKNIYYLASFYGFKNFSKAFHLVRNAKEKFIIPDDFLKISDYFFFLFYPFRLIATNIKSISFKNFDITNLIKSEQWQNSCSSSSFLALLNYRFALRLAGYGIKVRLLLKWYENQVNDRGMILGFRKFSPETKIIGYQGFLVSKIPNIHSIPTSFEVKCLLTPHTIAVIGKKLLETPNEFGANIDVIVAPAFRFRKLWETIPSKETNKMYSILLGLPISIAESCYILKFAAETIKNFTSDYIQGLVKPHPVNPPELLLKACCLELPKNFKFIEGDFNDLLLKSNLLITNGSTVCMEALAKGIPVIIIGNPNGFTQNPIPDTIPKNLWKLCYTKNEVINSIDSFRKSFLMNNAPERSKLANDIRSDFFEPVTPDKSKALLEL